MRLFWRKWLTSPKHGLARGVAVYGSPGFGKDAGRLTALLAGCANLRAWAAEQGVELDQSPGSLAAVDRALGRADDHVRRALANNCGLYLGTVILRNQPRAEWQIWPNGHPVVKLASGQELDVVACVHSQTDDGLPSLAALYSEAIHG